jgi:predicted lipoprotein with Yx(FWY)xxD motif
MKRYPILFAMSGVVVMFAVFGLAGCAPAAAPAATAPAPAPTTAPAAAVSTTPATATTAVTVVGPAIKLARVQGFGLFLTDETDRTLYAFDKDAKDTSNCTGNCLTTWPPYIVHSVPQALQGINAALLSTFARADGTTQAQYDVHPLYYYSGDKNPGDFKGYGVGNVWHVLSPRGSPMTNAAPTIVPTP